MKTILMSIRKEPFEALLDGKKRHEFRRRFHIKEPCQVVFYVGFPVSAICGVGIFDVPIEDSIENIVKIIEKHDFSSSTSLRKYLGGLERAYALPIIKSKKISPISLGKLREEITGFSPPQSYCSFDTSKFKNLLGRLELYETPDEIV